MARRFIDYRNLKPLKGITYSKAQLRRLSALPAGDPRKFPEPISGLGKEKPYSEDEVDEYVERLLAAARRTEA